MSYPLRIPYKLKNSFITKSLAGCTINSLIFGKNISASNETKAFNERLKYGKEAEKYVYKYLKKRYSKIFDIYTCEEYCERTCQEWSNVIDTRWGDIILCFKGSNWKAAAFNVKRSEVDGKISTATYYGMASDEFNLWPYNFYFSTYKDCKDESHYEIIWGQCLADEQTVRNSNNKFYWDRQTLKRYAVPVDDAMKIIVKRKYYDKNLKKDDYLWCEFEALYKRLNASLLKTSNCIGIPYSSNSTNNDDSAEVGGDITNSNTLSTEKPLLQEHLYSETKGFYATLPKKMLEIAEGQAEIGKDTLFVFHYYHDEKEIVDVYYSEIKDKLPKSKEPYFKFKDIESLRNNKKV